MTDFAVLLATYRRPELLRDTLASMTSLITCDFHHTIVVVDNADCEETKRVVESFNNILPIQFLVERKRGKNNALNTALLHVRADYYVFTDDDVIVDPFWLSAIAEGVERWQSHSVFGGRILPAYPEGCETHQQKIPMQSNYITYAFCIADWGAERVINPMCVWGANLVIKASVFGEATKFNENVGPSGGSYIMGSETELVVRLNEAGHAPVYLPQATVYHRIRPEQLTLGWLRKRALRSGRGEAFRQGLPDVPYLFGVPRFYYRKILVKFLRTLLLKVFGTREAAFDEQMGLFEMLGAMCQYRQLCRK